MAADRITSLMMRATGTVMVMAALTACAGGQSSTPALVANTTSGTPQPGGDNQDLLRAGETARAAVADSTVTDMERNDNSPNQWAVRLVGTDGTVHRVEVSADGSKVLSGPTALSGDADDKAENRSTVEALKIYYREAVAKATQEVPGRVPELNVDTENGALVWEVDVVDSGDTHHEVNIDAKSGAVVSKD